jgi:hypothetical protein
LVNARPADTDDGVRIHDDEDQNECDGRKDENDYRSIRHG